MSLSRLSRIASHISETGPSEFYSLQIYCVILYEGARHRARLSANLIKLATPKQGLEELKGKRPYRFLIVICYPPMPWQEEAQHGGRPSL